MPQSHTDVGVKWIKVITSLILSPAPGVCLYFYLTAENPDTRNLLSFMLLPTLLITILAIIACLPSEQELAPIGDEYLVDLLVKKPDWQHNHDANAWVSMGKFIRVGTSPEDLKTQSGVSPLDHLIAIKKQGFWLVPPK